MEEKVSVSWADETSDRPYAVAFIPARIRDCFFFIFFYDSIYFVFLKDVRRLIIPMAVVCFLLRGCYIQP